MTKFFLGAICFGIYLLFGSSVDAKEIYLLCTNQNKSITQTEKDPKGYTISRKTISDDYPEFEVFIDETSGTGCVFNCDFKVYKEQGLISLFAEKGHSLLNRDKGAPKTISYRETTLFSIERDTLNYNYSNNWDYSAVAKSSSDWHISEQLNFSSGKCIIQEGRRQNKI